MTMTPRSNSNHVVDEQAKRINDEIQQLLIDIRRIGPTFPDPMPKVMFGELFDDNQVEQFYEALVGTLKCAKKRGFVHFQGQMLLKGMHDNVVISIQEDGNKFDNSEDYGENTPKSFSLRNSSSFRSWTPKASITRSSSDRIPLQPKSFSKSWTPNSYSAMSKPITSPTPNLSARAWIPQTCKARVERSSMNSTTHLEVSTSTSLHDPKLNPDDLAASKSSKSVNGETSNPDLFLAVTPRPEKPQLPPTPSSSVASWCNAVYPQTAGSKVYGHDASTPLSCFKSRTPKYSTPTSGKLNGVDLYPSPSSSYTTSQNLEINESFTASSNGMMPTANTALPATMDILHVSTLSPCDLSSGTSKFASPLAAAITSCASKSSSSEKCCASTPVTPQIFAFNTENLEASSPSLSLKAFNGKSLVTLASELTLSKIDAKASSCEKVWTPKSASPIASESNSSALVTSVTPSSRKSWIVMSASPLNTGCKSTKHEASSPKLSVKAWTPKSDFHQAPVSNSSFSKSLSAEKTRTPKFSSPPVAESSLSKTGAISPSSSVKIIKAFAGSSPLSKESKIDTLKLLSKERKDEKQEFNNERHVKKTPNITITSDSEVSENFQYLRKKKAPKSPMRVNLKNEVICTLSDTDAATQFEQTKIVVASDSEMEICTSPRRINIPSIFRSPSQLVGLPPRVVRSPRHATPKALQAKPVPRRPLMLKRWSEQAMISPEPMRQVEQESANTALPSKVVGKAPRRIQSEATIANGFKSPSMILSLGVASQVQDEVHKLLLDIRRVGSGEPRVKFGALFDDEVVQNTYEALVGTLKSAKRQGLIKFNGQMLLKGLHDNVEISVVE